MRNMRICFSLYVVIVVRYLVKRISSFPVASAARRFEGGVASGGGCGVVKAAVAASSRSFAFNVDKEVSMRWIEA